MHKGALWRAGRQSLLLAGQEGLSLLLLVNLSLREKGTDPGLRFGHLGLWRASTPTAGSPLSGQSWAAVPHWLQEASDHAVTQALSRPLHPAPFLLLTQGPLFPPSPLT